MSGGVATLNPRTSNGCVTPEMKRVPYPGIFTINNFHHNQHYIFEGTQYILGEKFFFDDA
jgi:hypothetical protein